jgi:thiol-disulfide isomerase/thioredoxin
MNFQTTFESGLSYQSFLEKYGSESDCQKWSNAHNAVKLSAEQADLISGFSRAMNVLVMAGAWCGDCVSQCPIFDHIAAANSKIVFRYVDRDADPQLAQELKICGGSRVPQIVIMSEDFLPVSREGDRTLSRYRQMAADQLGAACPTGLGLDSDPTTKLVVQDWVDIFERAQLILRLSPSLRKKHND